MDLELTRPALLALLALLPLFLWLQRVRRAVSTTDRIAVWDRALRRAGVPRRRPWTLRLVLTLLCFVALVLAAAGLRRPERPGFEHLAVLIDGSVSMTCRDAGGGTRLDRAVGAARVFAAPEWIDRRRYVVRADRIDAAGSESPVVATGRADLGLARAFAERAGARTCVVLFADGAGPSPWPETMPDNLFLRGVGTTTENRGIVAASVTDPWPGPDLRLKLVTLPRGLALERGGERIEPVAPGLYVLPRGAGGDVAIGLETAADAFPADDTVKIRVQPPWAPRLLALPEGEPELVPLARYLEAALGARSTATRAEFAAALDDGVGSLQLIEGGELDAWPTDGGVRILFGTALPGLEGDVKLASFVEWDRATPLLSGLDLSPLTAKRGRGRSGTLPRDARTLAWAGTEPVLILSEGHRCLWFGVTLGTSNLRALPFLPLLVVRALRVLAGPGGRSSVAAGLLDAAESRVAARPAGAGRGQPVFYRPALELWSWLLGAALVLFGLRLLV